MLRNIPKVIDGYDQQHLDTELALNAVAWVRNAR